MKEVEEEIADGERLLGMCEYDKALKHFNKAAKMSPENARAFFGKAEASIGNPKVKPEKIADLYKKAIDLEPENPQYIEAYASFCMDAGRFNEAEQFYVKASELDPDSAPYYLSEFAIQYYSKAPIIMERFLDEKTKDMIASKSLEYLLRALGIERDDALRLLK
ncbi:MAG: tetratricopeptide repeat protein [Thermoplasmata archaeon]|nr:tetratricopeptide repeat protein [Candidatus Thermoplasmatota archaeon]MCK4457064.1 tetratricopeptide repeat protein [Thermoplasmata archaeon]